MVEIQEAIARMFRYVFYQENSIESWLFGIQEGAASSHGLLFRRQGGI
jgi:hypothetical protein